MTRIDNRSQDGTPQFSLMIKQREEKSAARKKQLPTRIGSQSLVFVNPGKKFIAKITPIKKGMKAAKMNILSI